MRSPFSYSPLLSLITTLAIIVGCGSNQMIGEPGPNNNLAASCGEVNPCYPEQWLLRVGVPEESVMAYRITDPATPLKYPMSRIRDSKFFFGTAIGPADFELILSEDGREPATDCSGSRVTAFFSLGGLNYWETPVDKMMQQGGMCSYVVRSPFKHQIESTSRR